MYGDPKIEQWLEANGWNVVDREHRPARSAEYVSADRLKLSTRARRALEAFPEGIYRHQLAGISTYLEGKNLAVTTPTASGKTLIFNVCALELLSTDPTSRILAIYPLKALAHEQTARWEKLVDDAGLAKVVGRIDGSVPVKDRFNILKASRIVVMTPDVMHAWLFSSLASDQVRNFLRNLRLIVIDEAHTYSGVFGSNSAFLFRRLMHVIQKLQAHCRYIASSATMQDPAGHLERLTGQPFSVVGPDQDTSPRSQLCTIIATPPGADVLAQVSKLIAYAASDTDHQSITFVDSRKQTEYLATIVSRIQDADASDEVDFDKLAELKVYPYRSGYEEEDRQKIQNLLFKGSLRGVISTSALEMGIDLPHLSLGVLFGMPRSATSYYQRIGRVGRRKAGTILIVNNGSAVSQSIAREPAKLKTLPLSQSALYLHNTRIQYIHAMCLASQGGEDATVSSALGSTADRFSSPLDLPADFRELCEKERVGEIPYDLQSMKSQAGEDPHHTFPLRDLDTQFQVRHQKGPNISFLGSLSYSQLLREAYPGAVYYYQTKPFRVVRVRINQRLVEVRQEKRYFTSPVLLPPLILPNMSGDGVYSSKSFGSLIVTECALQVGESVVGYKERRGNSETVQSLRKARQSLAFSKSTH